MKISAIETFVVHAPVKSGGIRDSTHTLSHWGVPGVKITAEGVVGWGFTGTHAHLASDRVIVDLIENSYGPLLLGRDIEPGESTWEQLYRHPPLMWVGRTGLTSLALSAIDIALWDLKAKLSGQPLWSLLGGHREKPVRAYDTDGGWLSLSDQELADEAREKIGAGFTGVKMKIGQDDASADLRRIGLVREAIGANSLLMVDVNGRWDLPTAMHVGRHLADFDVRWVEEPLWFTDVAGHAALARILTTPIALGEQLYTADEFSQFLNARAVHFVQPDAVRLAGITEWLRVAALAAAAHLPVVPHVGDMLPVHTQLAFAHPTVSELEYIPWLLPCLVEQVKVAGGYFLPPEAPGAGTELNDFAMREYRVA